MIKENLQIDSQVNNIVNALFSVGSKELTYASRSHNEDLIPQSAPIGVIMTGGQLQVILSDQDDVEYEAYVYYYNKHEGPRMFILQTLKSMEE